MNYVKLSGFKRSLTARTWFSILYMNTPTMTTKTVTMTAIKTQLCNFYLVAEYLLKPDLWAIWCHGDNLKAQH